MLLAFFNKIKKDGQFRVKFFLCASFIFNLIYATYLLTVSLVDASNWFFVMAIYYALLAFVRIYLFIQASPKKGVESNLKTTRICGYVLLLLNLVVAAMIFILIYTKRDMQHHEITVIALATYTFASLTFAIVGNVKLFKKDDHIFFCVKQISLISASVSMITLTNTMLATFGEDVGLLRSIILPILSGAVSIFIIGCALFLIWRANVQLRILKDEKE